MLAETARDRMQIEVGPICCTYVRRAGTVRRDWMDATATHELRVQVSHVRTAFIS